MSSLAVADVEVTERDALRKIGLQMRQGGHIEVPIDPDFLGPRIAAAKAGMERVTNDPALQGLFPWRAVVKDVYGKEYYQEAGLKHETRRDENKFVFQYIEGAFLPGVLSDSRCGAFLSALHDLSKEALRISIDLCDSIDESYLADRGKSYVGKLRSRLAKGTVVTRALRYLPVKNGASDAHPHVDRSAFSVHWGASHQGLWVYDPSGERHRIAELDPGRACTFFGRKGAAIMRSLDRGTPHGVKYDRVGDEDRYSFVSFVHPQTNLYDALWLLERDADMKVRERALKL